jgi:hypothetical protein
MGITRENVTPETKAKGCSIFQLLRLTTENTIYRPFPSPLPLSSQLILLLIPFQSANTTRIGLTRVYVCFQLA